MTTTNPIDTKVSRTTLSKVLALPPAMMKIASAQCEPHRRRSSPQMFPRPSSLGTTAYVENARRFGPDLKPVCEPNRLLLSANEPAFSDIRGDYTHIFTLDADNALSHYGTIDTSGKTEVKDEKLATLPCGVKSAHGAGSFTVLLLDDDTLRYMDYDGESKAYTWLGALPEMPGFRAGATEQPESTAAISSYEFAEPVSDFRTDIDKKIAQRLAEKTRTALKEAMRHAAASGLRTAPCAVRVGVRLWDGRLVHLSSPKVVGVGRARTSYVNAVFPLASGSAGFTGTGATTVSLEAYRLDVEAIAAGAGEVIPEAWKGLVRQIEVWVADAAEDAWSDDFSIYHHAENGVYTLEVRIARAEAENIVANLAEAPSRLLGTLPLGTVESIAIGRDDSQPTQHPAAQLSTFAPRRAKAATSHDGFLHLANVARELPRPEIPESVADDDTAGLHRVRIEVELTTRRGRKRITGSGYLTTLRIGPLLWYPDTRADIMRIGYYSGSDYYSAEFPLRPSATGEGAYYSPEGASTLSLKQLCAKSEEGKESAESVWEEHPEEIVSSHRGNPFAISDSIGSAGDRVNALVAQMRGGGAYTRQYLYVFTQNGISALVHDMYGHYTNLRSVSAARVSDAEQCAVTPHGVFVLTGGELLSIRDAAVSHLLRGLKEYTRLMWESTHGELWLSPAEDCTISGALSLAVDPSTYDAVGVEGSMRSTVPGKILHNSGHPLYAEKRGVRWVVMDTEGAETEVMDAIWMSASLPLPTIGLGVLRTSAGGWKDMEFEIKMMATHPFTDPGEVGDKADGSLRESEDIMMTRVYTAHPAFSRVNQPIIVPKRNFYLADHNSFYVRVMGRFRYLRGVEIFKRNDPYPQKGFSTQPSAKPTRRRRRTPAATRRIGL